MSDVPLRRPIRIGISACLLGEKVRFDGGHKQDPFLTGTFGRFVEWVPVCPEVEAGLGTPREAMRLVRTQDGVRLLTVKTARDLTATLDDYAERRVEALATEELCGYVLKKDSPSCGLERVKVYGAHSVPAKSGRGRFAVRLVERFPDCPWRKHSPESYQQLGRLVARARTLPHDELERRYTPAFMAALTVLATRRKHTNVLQHMAGYFKDHLDRDSKSELVAAIEEYRRELVPLIVPMTLLRHHVRSHGVSYLVGQLHLEPHPKELMLRNHV